MIIARYQTRPAKPEQVEAILLTEDNLAAVVEWLNTFTALRPRLKGQDAYISTDPETGARRILSPFFGGWYRCTPGQYLVHVGHGEARSMSVEDFALTYELVPPGDPSVCSCITPQAHGHTEGDAPMQWDPDCKTCGRAIPAHLLAQAAEMYR